MICQKQLGIQLGEHFWNTRRDTNTETKPLAKFPSPPQTKRKEYSKFQKREKIVCDSLGRQHRNVSISTITTIYALLLFCCCCCCSSSRCQLITITLNFVDTTNQYHYYFVRSFANTCKTQAHLNSTPADWRDSNIISRWVRKATEFISTNRSSSSSTYHRTRAH